MRRTLTSALSLIMVIGASLVVSLAQKTTGDKAGLEKTVNTFFGFVKANDADKLKTYYTDDYTFTSPEGKLMSAADRIKMLKEPSGPTFVSASDIIVRTYGSAGMATGVATTTNAGGANQQSRFIQMWVWQGGKWRLAASQVTPIQ